MFSFLLSLHEPSVCVYLAAKLTGRGFCPLAFFLTGVKEIIFRLPNTSMLYSFILIPSSWWIIVSFVTSCSGLRDYFCPSPKSAWGLSLLLPSPDDCCVALPCLR